MGATKIHNFTPRQNQISRLAKALAHPARIGIIDHLLQNESATCDELVAICKLSQSTVSQHLQILLSADVISPYFLKNRQVFSLRLGSIENLLEYLDEAIERTISNLNNRTFVSVSDFRYHSRIAIEKVVTDQSEQSSQAA